MTAPAPPPRDRLVEAGTEVLDDLPLAKVIAGATTARIAEAAGVTTGSYFHHFATAAEFADALVLSLLQEPHDLSEQVDDMVGALAHLDLYEMLRASLIESWAVQSDDERMRRALRLQFAMWAHHGQALSQPHGDLHTVADVLRRSYEVRDQDSLFAWQQLLDATNRTFAEPFTAERVVIAFTAMHEGLLARQQVDPDSVDDTLFAEVGAVLSLAVTVPTGTRLRLSELATIGDQSALSPQARTGARRRRSTRDRVTRAATGLFGAGWEAVPISDVADAAGVSNQTVINLFRNVRSVAAHTFGRHVPTLIAAGGGEDEAPVPALRRVLARLAAIVATDPEPARALLEERLVASVRHGEPDEDDIRATVPVMAALLPHLVHLELHDEAPLEVGATLINTTLTMALGGPHPPERIAEMVLRLLPRQEPGLT